MIALDQDGDARIDFGDLGLHWVRWWHFWALERTTYTPEEAARHAARLLAAARDGDVAAVRETLALHTDRDAKMLTAVLNWAATWTEHDYVPNYRKQTWYKDTALIAASRNGHAQVVKLLLETGICALSFSHPGSDV